ncbi:MAG: DoxX family membrane protein [bacterium]|nr:DoxX family membrane protein [bacterium]
MNRMAIRVLRVGLAITFWWIGFLILRQPEVWGGYLSPWVVNLLPVSVVGIMIITGILDIIIGVALLINPLTRLAALVGSLHIVVVLITSGITDITVRDVGLLAGLMALAINFWPNSLSKSSNN